MFSPSIFSPCFCLPLPMFDYIHFTSYILAMSLLHHALSDPFNPGACWSTGAFCLPNNLKELRVLIHCFPCLDFLFLHSVYIFAGKFLLWKHRMYL